MARRVKACRLRRREDMNAIDLLKKHHQKARRGRKTTTSRKRARGGRGR